MAPASDLCDNLVSLDADIYGTFQEYCALHINIVLYLSSCGECCHT
jgi:hypothetical protein